MVRLLTGVALVTAACGPSVNTAADAGGDASTAPDADPADARPPTFSGNIYAHSYQNLYKVDPDTLERDPEVLRDIGRRFRGRLALNSDVACPGTIAIGDPVTLVRPR